MKRKKEIRVEQRGNSKCSIPEVAKTLCWRMGTVTVYQELLETSLDVEEQAYT